MSKVYVVGIGPGGPEQITPQARAAMDRAEVLCGYTVYLELVKGLYPDKEIYTTPMRQELERCRWALETAQSGRTVALLCSGDPGVYGMAGPLLELAQSFPEVEVEIVPGVTAALSGGALLGAPLGHDFCVVSLSDLLTSWEVIERRLECAAQGDFALCLYNPASKKRADYLKRACDILCDTKIRRQSAAGCRTSAGRGRSTKFLTWPSFKENSWTCLPPFSSAAAPRRISAAGWSPPEDTGYEASDFRRHH